MGTKQDLTRDFIMDDSSLADGLVLKTDKSVVEASKSKKLLSSSALAKKKDSTIKSSAKLASGKNPLENLTGCTPSKLGSPVRPGPKVAGNAVKSKQKIDNKYSTHQPGPKKQS